jgi:hypothetical protein
MQDASILIIIVVSLFLYFLPTVIGWRKRNATAIFVLNFFLGWTFVGWIVALVWACTQDSRPTVINNHVSTATPRNLNEQLAILNKMRDMGKITNDEYWEETKRLELI